MSILFTLGFTYNMMYWNPDLDPDPKEHPKIYGSIVVLVLKGSIDVEKV